MLAATGWPRRVSGRKSRRTLLIVLAGSAFPIGLWAYFSPRSWYEHFPGFGMTWLPQLGAYNEHFCSDVGATYLALTALTVMAAIYVDSSGAVKLTAVAWLTFNSLHLAYHLRTLHMYDTRDAVLMTTTLSIVALISAALLIPGQADE